MVRELVDIAYQEIPDSLHSRSVFIIVCNYKLGGYRKDKSRLFSEMHNDRTNSNEHKLEHGKF